MPGALLQSRFQVEERLAQLLAHLGETHLRTAVLEHAPLQRYSATAIDHRQTNQTVPCAGYALHMRVKFLPTA